MVTHEQYLESVRNAVTLRLNDDAARLKLNRAKIVYGAGRLGIRGTCFYDCWRNADSLELIEISAFGEESPIQLAGTTIHELAHCLAGPGTGHGHAWSSAAALLGLRQAKAAGQTYKAADFDPSLWQVLHSLPGPSDGQPIALTVSGGLTGSRACPQGIGTRGGQSRGPGSGSRLRLYLCACAPPVKIRVARDENTFRACCLDCGTTFRRAEKPNAGDAAETIAQY